MTGQWKNSCYIVDGSILGTVEKGFGRWFAYACIKEWNDHRLGDFVDEEAAQQAVEDWVDDTTD